MFTWFNNGYILQVACKIPENVTITTNISWLQNHSLDQKPHEVSSSPGIPTWLCSPHWSHFLFPPAARHFMKSKEKDTRGRSWPHLSARPSDRVSPPQHVLHETWETQPLLLLFNGAYSQPISMSEPSCTPMRKRSESFLKTSQPIILPPIETSLVVGSACTGLKRTASRIWVSMTQQSPALRKAIKESVTYS